jgi:sec-independent protein translocase protein TatB
MFEVGFTEIILILGIALVVLGPEKLPKVAAEIGRWLGRARAMARQLKSQLDEEVIKADRSWSSPQPKKPPPRRDAGDEAAKPAAAAGGAGAGEPGASETSAAETPASDPAAPSEAGKQPETEFKPSP